jgi:hypothetical protein
VSLRAGAGKAAVDLPASLFPVDGFTAVHDPLHVRVLVLDDAATRLAVAVIEQTSIFEDQIARTKEILHQVCGVDPAHSLVVASHTFSAPHIQPPERAAEGEQEKNARLSRAVDDAVARAAAEATRTLRPARTGFGLGRSRVNVQRDVRTPHGWWIGADDSGPTDDSLGVLRIDGPDGHPIAVLVNHAVQSSVMNGSLTRAGERQVTADLAGAAARQVEEHYGDGTVVLFLIGAAGDQAPYLTAVRTTVDEDGTLHQCDVHEAGHALVELLGDRLAAEAVRVGEHIRATEPTAPLRVVNDSVKVPAQLPPAGGLHALRPATRYDFTPDGASEAPVVVARIGDTVLVGLQAELNAGTGIDLKAASPFPGTCVVTMVNGAAKYLADAGSYDRITYEAMNSRYAKSAAETVTARLVEILRSL